MCPAGALPPSAPVLVKGAVAALLALALAAGAAPAPAEAAARPACFAAKGRTVALSPAARLFTRRNRLFGCLRTRRPARLATGFDDGYVESDVFSAPRLAGRYAAFTMTHTDISCKAACPPDYDPTQESIVHVDLRRLVRTALDDYDGGTWDLTATGWVAWIAPERVVWAFKPGTLRELGRDDGIDLASLQASRSRVTWLQDGAVTGAGLP
jgi:hypothetical protein